MTEKGCQRLRMIESSLNSDEQMSERVVIGGEAGLTPEQWDHVRGRWTSEEMTGPVMALAGVSIFMVGMTAVACGMSGGCKAGMFPLVLVPSIALDLVKDVVVLPVEAVVIPWHHAKKAILIRQMKNKEGVKTVSTMMYDSILSSIEKAAQ